MSSEIGKTLNASANRYTLVFNGKEKSGVNYKNVVVVWLQFANIWAVSLPQKVWSSWKEFEKPGWSDGMKAQKRKASKEKVGYAVWEDLPTWISG